MVDRAVQVRADADLGQRASGRDRGRRRRLSWREGDEGERYDQGH